MSNYLMRWMLIAIGISLVVPAYAQFNTLGFQTLLSDNAPGEIQVIFQDKQGYMWFGGRNSLLRYNAYEFQPMYISTQGAEGAKISSPNFTKALFEDSRGALWLACHSGLFIFDPDREIFNLVTPLDGTKEPIYTENFHSIKELPTGEMIAGSNLGVVIINRDTLRAERLSINDNESLGLSDAVVIYDVIIDQQQRIWLGSKLGLFLFDYQQRRFSHFIPDPDNPASVTDNSLWSLGLDSHGNIWGGTIGGGLHIFNPQTRSFRHYKQGLASAKGLPDDTVWDILKDSEGVMWLAHNRNGFSKYNEVTDQFEVFAYPFKQPGSLLYNSVRSIFEDKNKDMWVGEYPSGISFHDSSTEAILIHRPIPNWQDSIENENVLALMEDKKGNYWLSVGTGVSYYDRQTEKFTRYNKASGTYGANGTLSGYLDHLGQVWVGTWSEGYHRYNPKTNRFDALPVNPKLALAEQSVSNVLNDATVWGFCETKDGSLYIGTHNAGISRYDAENNLFTKYLNQTNSNTSLTNNIAWACLEDSQGRFWVATAYGLSLMNQQKTGFKQYPPQEQNIHGLRSGSVFSIFEDSKGRLWFGTDKGLHLYREKTDDFNVFTQEDGFNDPSIRAITEDRSGNLWLGTNNGIVQFNPVTYKVKNFTEHNGKNIGGINTGAGSTSLRGELVFGGVDGLIFIDPKKLLGNKIPPPTVFTDFKIFTKSVDPNSSENILTKVANQTDSITLDYTKRMFSFEFSALNYRSSENNSYAYMLQGFDEAWREVGNQRKAQYTNLSPGNYIFKVKASNNDNVWNEEEKSIAIHQLPPPWRTWWAYSLYGFIIFSVLANFVYSQRKKRGLVEAQNRILELKIVERTADLAEKNKDIQTLLTTIKQGLFTIDTEGEIHHEYSSYLENIFETKDISGKKAFDFLFANALLESDGLNQISTAIDSIVDFDQMNYEMNAHLLIPEYQVTINDKIKTIALDWSPIIDDDGTVNKLMVSTRDITQLKMMETEAVEQKLELEIIGQLINVSAKKYTLYYESVKAFVNESRNLILSAKTGDEHIISVLFRNMHTIKGNSRNCGFTLVSNAAHEAENEYSELRSDLTKWNPRTLLSNLNAVNNYIDKYQNIYNNVLAREHGKSRATSGHWFEEAIIADVKTCVENIKKDKPEDYRKITDLLDKGLSAPIGEVLSDSINALSNMADQLGKHHPEIKISDQGIRLKESVQPLVCDVFSHLFRNSIDHGIEEPKERERKYKDKQGCIVISLYKTAEFVTITFKDDGRGLNLEKLFNKAIEMGRWSSADKPSHSMITQLIFESGMSTKESVSDISGRGVGMDAVKQFLVQAGGDIQIVTDSPNKPYIYSDSAPNIPFEMRIILPILYFVVDDTASVL